MAEASPTGMATISPQKTTVSVPITIGRTPKLALANAGAHSVPVRNSRAETCSKKLSVGRRREITIAVVTATDSAAHPNRNALIAFSPYRGLVAPSCGRGNIPACSPEATKSDAMVLLPDPTSAGEALYLRQSLFLLLGRQADVAGCLGDLRLVLDVELDEREDFRPLQRSSGRVDEEAAPERRVAPVLDGLERRLDAAVTAVDGQGLDAVLVLDV